MKNIYIITAFLVLNVVSGCKKLLDKTPEDGVSVANYFTKENDAVLALNGAYDLFGERNTYWGGPFQHRMMAADDVYSVLVGNAGEFPANHKHNASTALVLNLWKNLFTIIERTNILLANLDKIPMDEGRKGVIRGEALFMRAYSMFMLVDLWGPVPINLEPTKGPDDVTRERRPIKEVYEQIVKDMLLAEGLVPSTGGNYGGGGYPAKTTVQGILARVYLTMAGEPLKDVSKYQDAKEWAMKAINSGEHRLNPDYTDIFIKLAGDQFDPKETMWELDYINAVGSNEWGQIGIFTGPSGARPASTPSTTQTGQTRATRLFFYAFETACKCANNTYSPDMRRDWSVMPFNYNANGKAAIAWSNILDRPDGKWRTKYEAGAKLANRTGINFPLLRYSDVLLMAAEAENAVNGPTQLAYDLVNQVRRRAYGMLLRGQTVKSVTMTNAGSGYTSAPTVTFSGGGGATQASGVAVRNANGTITGITVSLLTDDYTDMPTLQGGSFYSSAPTITLSGGGGSGATAVANLLTNADVDLPSNLSKESFLKAVQDERFREFSSEGNRKHDLIRWGIYESRLQEVKAEAFDPAQTVNPGTGRTVLGEITDRTTSRHLLYPIPAAEISLNTAITQNPGW